MKKKRLLSMILAVALLLSGSISGFATDTDTLTEPNTVQDRLEQERSYFSGGQSLNGVVIDSIGTCSYPQSSETGYWQLRPEAEEMVALASSIGMDTIFYPVNPQMGSMYHSSYLKQNPALSKDGGFSLKDPLKSLIKESESSGLSLCAVISPFDLGNVSYNEEYNTRASDYPQLVKQNGNSLFLDPSQEEVWKLIGNLSLELVSNYKINGVVIDFNDCFTKYGASLPALKNIMLSVRDNVRRRSSVVKIGVIFPKEMMELFSQQEILSFLKELAAEECVDFIMPQIVGSVSGENAYEQELLVWKNMLQTLPQLALFPYQDASMVLAPRTEQTFYSDPQETLFRQFSTQTNSVYGCVINSMRNILLLPSLYSDMSTPQNSSLWYEDSFLKKTSGLTVGSPADTVTTSQSSYPITGSCDPNQPLYLNGQEYQGAYGEILPSGYFSFSVPLSVGINSFSLEQNGKKRTVTITRTDDTSQETTPINCIQPESTYPVNDEIVSSTTPSFLSCVAPSGAQVTARIGTEVYPLTQVNPSIPQGEPAKYTAPLYLEEDHEAEVRILGQVSYSMTYGGKISQQVSDGKLILLGSQQTAAVQLTAPVTPVFKDSSESEILYVLPEGTKDSIDRYTEDHFYLSSGGCIQKDSARILTSTADIYTLSKKVKNVVIQTTNRGEYITFVGASSAPCAVRYDAEERVVTLTLSHITQMNDRLNYLNSDLFEDIQVDKDEDQVHVTLKLKENMPFYGYQVSFHEGNMIVYFRSHLSEDPRGNTPPLQGMNIVIDAGHGGKDLGADSLMGIQGANEEALNLAVAEALYDRLDNLGANVFLTRSDHSAMAGLDRVMVAQYREADLFLSIHHCGNQKSGISISCNQFGEELAQQLSDQLSKQLQCSAQPVVQTSSYPGDVSLAPSLNIDLGNLMNPSDYARASSSVNIYRTAYQLAEIIFDYVDQSNVQYQVALRTPSQTTVPDDQIAQS